MDFTKQRSVTYLLGAGASAKALPINAQTKDYIYRFASYLFHNPSIDDDIRSARLDIYPDFHWMLNAFEKHRSYDKFAKVLHFNGPDFKALKERHIQSAAAFGNESPFSWLSGMDGPINLARLKVLLATYYFFEQLRDKARDDFSLSVMDKNNPPEFALPKLNTLDDRLIELMRNCLPLFEDKLHWKVNFVTWNYDLQLELAYAHVQGITDIIDVLQENHLDVHPGRSVNRYSTDPRVIHANGIAGLMYSLTTGKMRLMNYGNEPFKSSIHELLKLNMNDTMFGHRPGSDWSHHETFSFAWEDHWPARQTLDFLHRRGLWTNILVIFGYSRPEDNERVDFRLLESFLTGQDWEEKKIVLCGRNAEAEIEQLRKDWLIPTRINIVADTNTERIPSPQELWTKFGPHPKYSKFMQ